MGDGREDRERVRMETAERREEGRGERVKGTGEND